MHEDTMRSHQTQCGVQTGQGGALPGWQQAMQFPVFSTTDFGAAVEDTKPSFVLQPSLTEIGYSSDDDVFRLYQSVNCAYVSPEGKGQEICQGYICSIMRGERKMIYIALYGLDSRRTRVYLPDTEIGDDAAYDRALAAAITFGEQVGLVMEPEKIETSQEQRLELIKRCPVLKQRG